MFVKIGNALIKKEELKGIRVAQDESGEFLILADWGNGEHIVFAGDEEEVKREFEAIEWILCNSASNSPENMKTSKRYKNHKLISPDRVKAAILLAIENGAQNYNEIKALLLEQGYDGRQIRKQWNILVREGQARGRTI